MGTESDEGPRHKMGGARAGGPVQRIGWITLVVLAFAGGWLLARAGRPDAAPDLMVGAQAPATATALAPTPVPVPTATPTSPEAGDTLPTLYIDIAPDDFAKIEAKREEALKNWILLATNADFVPATVRVGDGDPVQVQLRLKGDWGDHFAHDKWSYRIEVQGGDAVMGMSVFSIQDPSTRTYANEWAFMQALRREDVLTVGYSFAHVVQNGQTMGVYAVEEGFAKELLESQRRRESVIIRYNEDLLWETWAAYDNDFVTPPGITEFHLIDEFDSGGVAASPTLSAARDAAVGKLRAWWAGELPASEVFDIDRMARFWALADLWGANHALDWHNLRFYYNPLTTRLEPIAFDAQALGESAVVDVAELAGRRELLAYGDDRLRRAYAQALAAYTDPAYLAALQQDVGGDLASVRASLLPEFGGVTTPDGGGVLDAPWDALAERASSLRDWLSPPQMVYAYRPADVPTDTLVLDVGNLLGLPVQIDGVFVDGDWFPADASWATPGAVDELVGPVDAAGDVVLKALSSDAEFMPYARLRTSAVLPPEAETASVQLVTRVWGLSETVTRPVMASYPPIVQGALPTAPTVEQALAAHPYLQIDDTAARTLTMPAGTHAVSGGLILPEGYGLRLVPGTTLRFEPDAYLLARGPLQFDGTEDAPIVLGPSEDLWHGIVVLDAGAPSTWAYVTVEKTVAVSLPGWTVTGGITFYQSPISLDHCRILGTQAEDGLNTIRTTFHFADTEFASTFSDAFDSDFSQGDVVRSSFHDIGADGIDVSGTQVAVSDIRMVNLGDKGFSIGEASQLTATGVSVEDADFGIASKDLSRVVAQDVTVARARVAALAAYIKKPAYGPATIVANGVHFQDIPDDRLTLVQTGSWIDLDGERIWGTEVDVEALYAP